MVASLNMGESRGTISTSDLSGIHLDVRFTIATWKPRRLLKRAVLSQDGGLFDPGVTQSRGGTQQ